MSDNSWKKRMQDIDSFWDLDLLIDKRSRRSEKKISDPAEPTDSSQEVQRSEGTDRTSELCEVSAPERETDTLIKRYVIPRREENEPVAIREYRYEDSLIHSVRVYDWSSGYNYYEDFYRDVKKYFDVSVEDAEQVSFFSYVPQYSQMDSAQKKWYFYFRDRARRGEFIRVEYSYILLYCFELINSAELADPAEVIAQLTRVWKNYHGAYPQLNKYLAEWICDFGLIFDVSFPSDILGSEVSELMRSSTLKEYYASAEYGSAQSFVGLIIEFCSAYNYRLSRYYENNSAVYDRFIRQILEGLFESGILGGFTTESCNITRQAFVGALAPYPIKKRIQISYCSFSRTNEFRYTVGDIIKYSENKIREHLYIKSRLSVYGIDDEVRGYIDSRAAELLAGVERPKRGRAETRAQAEYEKLYDLPKKDFSLDEAKRIESSSWHTTRMLVEAFEDGDEHQCDDACTDAKAEACEETAPEPKTATEKAETEDRSPLAPYRELLSYILASDAKGQKRYAAEHGQMLEYLADRINEIGTELYGDMLVEEEADAYAPIEDYIPLIEKEVENG